MKTTAQNFWLSSSDSSAGAKQESRRAHRKSKVAASLGNPHVKDIESFAVIFAFESYLEAIKFDLQCW